MSTLSAYISGFDIPVQVAPFVPLSAVYPYDIKTTFSPKLYQYAEGYSFFHHPIFTDIKDVKAGHDSLFELTTARSLHDILTDVRYIESTELIIFTGLRAANGKYITNIDNHLYASASSVGPNEFFRIEKQHGNIFKIYQGKLLFTVDREDPWDITLEPEIVNDLYQTQKLSIFEAASSGFTIQTMFQSYWWDIKPTPPQYLQRFITFSPAPLGTVRATGMADATNYTAFHNYVFESTNDIGVFAIGYDGLIKWVKYYNEIGDKLNNKNANIKEIIDNVKQNYLIDCPYKTQSKIDLITDNLKVGTFNINLMGLKNVMTPEYEYDIKVRE
jgi:hypothetical protein